eukprot:scaffold43473_cov22-Prasinocladus_malaysianus.AAC.1
MRQFGFSGARVWKASMWRSSAVIGLKRLYKYCQPSAVNRFETPILRTSDEAAFVSRLNAMC